MKRKRLLWLLKNENRDSEGLLDVSRISRGFQGLVEDLRRIRKYS
jgi:hypothetical protein